MPQPTLQHKNPGATRTLGDNLDDSTTNVKPGDEPSEETAEERLARQYAEYLAVGYDTDANVGTLGELSTLVDTEGTGGTRRTQSTEDDGNAWQQNHRNGRQAQARNNKHGNSR